MSDEQGIVWEVPAEAKRGPGTGGKWRQLLAAMVAKPREWAVVDDYITTNGNSTKQWFRQKGCEVSQRTVTLGDGSKRHRVYARYVGNGATP